MGWFSKKAVAGAATAIIGLSSSFGFLMRDLDTFGKMEGDTRVISQIQKERRIFQSALKKLENISCDTRAVKEADVIIKQIRDSIKRLELFKGMTIDFKERGNYEKAEAYLERVLGGLSEFTDPDFVKQFKRTFIETGFGAELGEELAKILKELEEDVKSDLAEIEAEKEALKTAQRKH